MLASPFVGLSNDALALVRRSASKRPLFSGIEHSLPPALDERDTRLLRAFRQRFDRLAEAMTRLSLERLCERIVSEHDYDLAVLAQWDGRRRYANMRKLARLARSYEELRGPDVEGFVRFVNEREAVGARELEAVAEEEGGDAVRLLTIHAAKGLEFKVVIVADAGRDKAPPSPDEILALADGRFGFRVADPVTTKRRGAFDYDDVREARRLEEEAEKLRLYYVAMTRAKERLIVSGSIDREKKADASTPIGWVLERLDADEELAAAGAAPVEIERNAARLVVRIDRHQRERVEARPQSRPEPPSEETQLALFAAIEEVAAVRRRAACCRCSSRRPSRRSTGRAGSRSPRSRPSSSARTATTRATSSGCRSGGPSAIGDGGLRATEIGDAVHRLLEQVDLAAPAAPDLEQVRVWYPTVSDEELERIRGFVDAYCDSELARRVAALDGVKKERHFTFEHDGVLLHGYVDAMHLDGSTRARRRLQDELDRRRRRRRRSSRPTTACSGSSMRSRASARARRTSRSSTTSSSARTPSSRRRSRATRCRRSKRSSRRRSRASTRASSGRRRASSRAPAVRRSTSSAPGRCRTPHWLSDAAFLSTSAA